MRESRNTTTKIETDEVMPSSILASKEQLPTVATVLLEQLALWGIKHIYGVVGDANVELINAIQQQEEITFFSVGTENSAALMASTEGKCTERIGVCIGTSGPGLTNMLNGIADAAADHIPLLVLTGQVESKKVGTQTKQYVEQQQMIAPLAVFSTELRHPDATVELVKRAVIEALSKKGVAHLSIPQDLCSQPCNCKTQEPIGVLWNSKQEELHQLDKATLYLTQAQKPIILLGTGARGVTEWIVKLAETLKAGLVESLGGKGIIPYGHPLNIGGIGEGGSIESRNMLRQADCVLVIGANWWPEGFVPQHAKVISIDLEAANIEGHSQATCGLVGDVKQILPLLYQRVSQQLQVNSVSRDSWEQEMLEVKQKIVSQHQAERKRAGTRLSPQRMIAVLDETVKPDAILVVDTGDHTLWFNRIFRAQQQNVLFSGKWRTMGYGLPAAIAAKINYPDKQVVAIVGDGCLQMSCMELATVAKLSLPLTIIVLNNGALAMEQHKMESKGIKPFGVQLYNPDFATLAQAFGVQGIKVQEAGEWPLSLVKALENEGPVLLDVQVANIKPPFSEGEIKLIH